MGERIKSLAVEAPIPIKPENHFDRVLTVLYAALDEVSVQLPKDRQVKKSPSSALLGAGGVMDSLTLSNFIVMTEHKLEQSFGLRIDLTQDDPFSPGSGHFRTIQSLASYISQLMKQATGELLQ